MHVVLIAVISLDGRITPPGQAGPGFASTEDHLWFRSALEHFSCSVLGRETFAHLQQAGIPAVESERMRVVMTRNPAAHSTEQVPNAVEFSSAPPATVIDDLRTRGHERCAVIGGGKIYRLFLDAGLVDALWLTLEPVVLGGGTPLADGIVRDGHFELMEKRALSRDTLLLNYRRPGTAGVSLPPP